MALNAGTQLGQYEVLGLLGKGGMGEVYRARDSKLVREVALKVLPAPFAQSPERVARFRREAQLLASLNHPNIAAIHGLEDSGAINFLVLELVPGETLAQRISAAGPLPIEEALGLSKQIAEALEAAHDKGVIHRDLKPANIKITPEGKIKVLDFGLAKAYAGEEPSDDPTESPTMSAMATAQGVILGTAAYMSPEQARGKKVDKRTDIWAFGAVLYELLTGRQAFYGEDVTDILAAVVKSEPDWTALPAATPPGIRTLLRRCLQKDMTKRLRDATDARLEIDDALAASTAIQAGTSAPVASRPHIRQIALTGLAGLLAGGIIAGLVVRNFGPQPTPQPSTHLMMALPPNATLVPNSFDLVALSPDGTHLAYVAVRTGAPPQLYLRAMDALESNPIAGTEGAVSPFFSPDGQWIGFFSGATLKKISVSGGAALTLCSANGARGAAWGPDDTIVFTPTNTSGLVKVSAAGGEPQPFTTLQQGETSHRWPQFLPDGKAVLFTVGSGGNYDNAQIAVQRLDSGERKVLVRGGAYARYVPTGHLVYYRAGTIMAVPFDPDRLELKGNPAPVVEGVLADTITGAAQFSLSNLGSLAYVAGGPQSTSLNLVWVDRHGAAQLLPAPLRTYRAPRLSPDGRQVTVGIGPDVWIYDIPRDTLTRFTFEGSNANTAALWTPDGKRVVFPSNRGGGAENLFWKPADGSGPEERLTTSKYTQRAGSLSPDGRTEIYSEIDPKTSQDLWVLPLDGDRKPHLFLQTPFNESSGQFSPDGHWVAYVSDESGRLEVYVRPFPGPGGKWQLSTEGGSEVAWSPKGNELFYRTGGQKEKMMAVDVQTHPIFSVGKPRLLFEEPYVPGIGAGAMYSVSPDGQRFLMMKAADQSRTALTQINVVLNWFEELTRKVPVK